jgi:hypothetical protein
MQDGGLGLLNQIRDFLFRDVFYFVSGLFIFLSSLTFIEISSIKQAAEIANNTSLSTLVVIAIFFLCYIAGFALNELLILLRFVRTKYHKPGKCIVLIASSYMSVSSETLTSMPETVNMDGSDLWKAAAHASQPYADRMERIVNLMHIGQTMFGSFSVCTILLVISCFTKGLFYMTPIFIVTACLSVIMFLVQRIKNFQLSLIYNLIHKERYNVN